ncbi:hypothetical protein STEG23_001748 [Scotinomys teguina]
MARFSQDMYLKAKFYDPYSDNEEKVRTHTPIMKKSANDLFGKQVLPTVLTSHVSQNECSFTGQVTDTVRGYNTNYGQLYLFRDK